MKIQMQFTLLMSLLTIGSPMGAQDSKAPRGAFTITINTPQIEVRVGSPMPVAVTVRNTSNHDIAAGVVMALGGTSLRLVDIKVWNEDGKPIHETEHGQKVHGRHRDTVITTVFSAPLSPGKSLQEESDLMKEFDLSKPGKYTVQAQRIDPQSRVVVKSNKITFIVTQ